MALLKLEAAIPRIPSSFTYLTPVGSSSDSPFPTSHPVVSENSIAPLEAEVVLCSVARPLQPAGRRGAVVRVCTYTIPP